MKTELVISAPGPGESNREVLAKTHDELTDKLRVMREAASVQKTTVETRSEYASGRRRSLIKKELHEILPFVNHCRREGITCEEGERRAARNTTGPDATSEALALKHRMVKLNGLKGR